jgi:hypothetical protein
MGTCLCPNHGRFHQERSEDQENDYKQRPFFIGFVKHGWLSFLLPNSGCSYAEQLSFLKSALCRESGRSAEQGLGRTVGFRPIVKILPNNLQILLVNVKWILL